jgi:putative ABC transport system ATP-binding protein
MLGTNIFSLGEKELAGFRGKNIGIVFQQFHLMPHLTTLENVMLPLEILRVSGAASTAQGVLDRVGLGTRATHFPHQLSGGECQRVAIARAFVVKPKVLLADEPSGNLDQRTGDNVMNMLFDLAVETGMTMVLVTHNEGLAERCQRRLVLTEGQIRNTNPA